MVFLTKIDKKQNETKAFWAPLDNLRGSCDTETEPV